jgi:hypothetical protein
MPEGFYIQRVNQADRMPLLASEQWHLDQLQTV